MAAYGLSRLVAVGVGCVIALGTTDYWIRFDDPGIRVINSLVLVGLTAWAFRRYARGLLWAQLGDLRLAQEIQRRTPELGDRLATAIEFLRQPDDDPTAGSPSLRRAVIAEVTKLTSAQDFSTVLDPRPARRAACLAAASILAAAILMLLDPVSCRTAVARLASPLGSRPWPQLNHLEYRRRVEQVARGQAFEVEVVAAHGTPLPSEVRILYRFERPDGTQGSEVERMRRQGVSMIARRENVTRPFSYRVEGGDDHSQPWIDVSVVEPPALLAIAVRLIPPEYTGWPAYESNKQIRVLAGTKAEYRGTATKPLASAALVSDDGRSVPAQLVGEEQFQLPGDSAPSIVLDRSGVQGLILTDRQ